MLLATSVMCGHSDLRDGSLWCSLTLRRPSETCYNLEDNFLQQGKGIALMAVPQAPLCTKSTASSHLSTQVPHGFASLSKSTVAAYVRTQTYIPRHLPALVTCVHSYPHAYLPTYVCTHLHTCIKTYICTYMLIYMNKNKHTLMHA